MAVVIGPSAVDLTQLLDAVAGRDDMRRTFEDGVRELHRSGMRG